MEELFAAVAQYAWLVYLLTFLFIFVETSGLPLPALSFALLAATLAGQGSLNFWAVVVATILGGTLGGPVGHAMGLRRGRPLLEQMGSKVGITPQRLDTTEEQFKGRGKGFVLARFFVPILPWSAGLFAGIVGMPRRTLFLFTFLSITLWALIELTIVAYFSSVLKDLLQKFGSSCLFWILTGIIGGFFLIRFFRFRKRQEAARAPIEAAIEAKEDAEAERESGLPAEAATAALSDASPASTTAAESVPDSPPQDTLASPGPTTEPTTKQLPSS